MLEFSDSYVFDAKLKFIHFPIESSTTIVMSLTEAVIEDIQPLVIEKDEIENRDKSKIISLPGIFEQSKFCCKDQTPWCFLQPFLYKCKFLIETLVKEAKLVIADESEFEN